MVTYSTPSGACSDATTIFFAPRMSDDFIAPVGPPNPSCCKGANRGLYMSSADRVKNCACRKYQQLCDNQGSFFVSCMHTSCDVLVCTLLLL